MFRRLFGFIFMALMGLYLGLNLLTSQGIADQLQPPDASTQLYFPNIKYGAIPKRRPPELELVGHLGGRINAVAVQGDFAFIGEGQELAVLDISNPRQPQKLGGLVFRMPIGGIELAGRYAYVTFDPSIDESRGKGDMHIVDISNPYQLKKVGSYQAPRHAAHVITRGQYAFVSVLEGLRILDIANPENPLEIGGIDLIAGYRPSLLQGRFWYLTVVGQFAYIAGVDLWIVDVSDATHPILVKKHPMPDFGARGIFVKDGIAYVVGAYNFYIVNVSQPDSPSFIGSFTINAQDVMIRDHFAFLASYVGLTILDIADPNSIRQIGELRTGGIPRDIFLVNNTAYVADWRFHILDITDYSNPNWIHAYDPVREPGWIAKYGQYLFVNDIYSLYSIDISNPTNPIRLARDMSPGLPRHFQVVGPYLYLAEVAGLAGDDFAEHGLRILSLDSLPELLQIGSFDTPDSPPNKVLIHNKVAFLANGQGGLYIIDVSDPQRPHQLSRLRFNAYPGEDNRVHDVFVDDKYAFVTETNGLRILDISIPTAPQRIGTYISPNNAIYAVYIYKGIAYLSTNHGIEMVNVTNPVAPTLIGSLAGGYVAGVWNDYALVCSGSDGLSFVDISDPWLPFNSLIEDTPAYVVAAKISEEILYVTDNVGGGLFVYKLK